MLGFCGRGCSVGGLWPVVQCWGSVASGAVLGVCGHWCSVGGLWPVVQCWGSVASGAVLGVCGPGCNVGGDRKWLFWPVVLTTAIPVLVWQW
eukprot:363737-Chlamydomonas_euryale.AAC.5